MKRETGNRAGYLLSDVIQCLYTNARGPQTKIGELQDLFLNEDTDITLITETSWKKEN